MVGALEFHSHFLDGFRIPEMPLSNKIFDIWLHKPTFFTQVCIWFLFLFLFSILYLCFFFNLVSFANKENSALYDSTTLNWTLLLMWTQILLNLCQFLLIILNLGRWCAGKRFFFHIFQSTDEVMKKKTFEKKIGDFQAMRRVVDSDIVFFKKKLYLSFHRYVYFHRYFKRVLLSLNALD